MDLTCHILRRFICHQKILHLKWSSMLHHPCRPRPKKLVMLSLHAVLLSSAFHRMLGGCWCFKCILKLKFSLCLVHKKKRKNLLLPFSSIMGWTSAFVFSLPLLCFWYSIRLKQAQQKEASFLDRKPETAFGMVSAKHNSAESKQNFSGALNNI